MKKYLSMLLVVALVLGMVPTVFAASTPTATITTDKTELKAGESIMLTFEIDQAIENLMNFQFTVYFDDKAYTKTGSSIGSAYAATTVGDYNYDYKGLIISGLDVMGDPLTLNAGLIATLTLTATDAITADNAAITVKITAMNDYDTISMIAGGVNLVGGNIDVTLAAEDPVIEGYTVTMGADKEVTVGESVNIPVSIGNADAEVTTYNAYDMTFSYDPALLTLNMTETSTEGYKVIPGDGTVQIQRYGKAAELGEALNLSFIAKSAGAANVKVTAAYVDEAANAIEFDAPAATVLDDTAVVTVKGYTVTLPDDFKSDDGTVVAEGDDFTFQPVDPNYDYTFSVTVGGTTTEGLTFGEDGTYTIEDIHGNVTVTVTEKTPKSFQVTLGDDITGAETATYQTDYSFILTQKVNFTYNVQVTIGGQTYTGFEVTDNEDGTYTYTIKGSDITGNIVINSNKEQTKTDYTVTFTGSGAGDIAEDTLTGVNNGQTYTFTLNKADGFTYTVTATMGGDEATVVEGENNTYSIANVTGDLVINIEKTSELGIQVEVSTYMEMDSATMYLVTVTGTPAEGKAFAYDDNVMYKTTAYGENVYSWLVIVGEGEDALTAEVATTKITAADATAEEVTKGYDVNMSGTVDINDAQLVYDMYNGLYKAFDVVSVRKFLNADVNADKCVNANDAVAIVDNAE